LASKVLYFVGKGKKAVVFDKFQGVKPEVYGEGVHALIPFVQQPVYFDIRAASKTINCKTGTNDLQIVEFQLKLVYRPDKEFLPSIYSNLGRNYDEQVLPSIGKETLKSIAAQYTAEQLSTQKEQVSKEILQKLTQRASEFHIILEDAAISKLDLVKTV